MTDVSFAAFLFVFVRCSAMFMSCPVFGAQNTPSHVRIFITLAVSGALTMAISPSLGPVPGSLYELAFRLGGEVLAGLLLGSVTSLAIQTAQMAGGLMDLQSGLGSSHVLNPLNGVQSTVLSQLKGMMAAVIFLVSDGHHLLIQAFVHSYKVMPSFRRIEQSLVSMLGEVTLLSLQIAAPVVAAGFLVDAALALLARAIPQVQVMQVGMSAKVGVGVATVALGLPMTVAGVQASLDLGFRVLAGLFHG
jgi:flagellar biosynthetic protein FliR